MRRAFDEWQSAMASRLDFPETHLQLGGTALVMRNLPAAENAFTEAARLDPQLIDAWIMQARLALALGDVAAATSVLARALRHNPGSLPLQLMHSQLTQDQLDLLPPPKEK